MVRGSCTPPEHQIRILNASVRVMACLYGTAPLGLFAGDFIREGLGHGASDIRRRAPREPGE
jgi:hypothetical protein